MFNTITISTPHVYWVETADNKVYPVKYNLVTRANCTWGHVRETLEHFRHACDVSAAGESWETGQWKEFEKRNPYGSEDTVLPAHDESVCQIFTNSFPIWDEELGKIVPFPINVMTELTPAYHLFHYVHWRYSGMATIRDIDEERMPETAQRESRQETNAHQETPQDTQPSENSGETITHSEDEYPLYMGAYNHKRRGEYRHHAGKVLVFDVCRLVKEFKTVDGEPVPYVEVYSSYNGQPSRYPSYSLKISLTERGWERIEADQYTAEIIHGILDDTHDRTFNWRGHYVMWLPADSDDVRPLLVKLEPATNDVPF